MIAITISTTSVGTPDSSGMFKAPTFNPPSNNAAKTTPIAVFPPNKATAIPSKPTPVKASFIDAYSKVPSPSIAPARPAKAPEMSMEYIMFFLTFIPAYWDAC